jgi:hypothetical protein
VFWFPNYQVESPIKTLYDTGEVRFADAGPVEKKEVTNVTVES